MANTTYDLESTTLERLFVRLNISKFHRIDCLSEQPKILLKRFFPRIKDERLRVAPCSFTDYSSVRLSQQREIDIVTMARFVPGKGYDLLQELKEQISGFNLHCYGFGPLASDLTFAHVGHANDPFEVLGNAKIFLSLQRVNNYPSQSVLEAMASGCAIIATDVGETRKFLNEDCAILIPYEAKALAIAIDKLMNDETLRLRLGSRSREKVLRDFTVDRYAQYFMEEIIDFDYSHHHRP
ncbi:MAG: glycosyltransferase [Betaproteobacteria bacterium]